MKSKTGRIIVRVEALMDRFARREDGSETAILADHRFDNHNKMTITGVVKVGADTEDMNPLEDVDRIMPRCSHYPLGYIGGGVFETDIREGDRVWFHYLCGEDRGQMERNRDGSWDVIMQVSDVLCLEREGKLIMNQNWVLGEPMVEKPALIHALGYEKFAEMTPGKGITLLEGYNLPNYVDEAFVKVIGNPRYRSVFTEVSPCDTVYLAKDSGFPNVIDNRQCLLFRHTDILAVFTEDHGHRTVRPVGENHLVRVKAEEYKATRIHHTPIIKAPEYGKILSSGKHCLYSKDQGEYIVFTRRWTRLLTKELWLVADSEIQCTVYPQSLPL